MTYKRANSSVDFGNLHMFSSVVLLSCIVLILFQQEYIFHPQVIKKPRGFGNHDCPLCFASGSWRAHNSTAETVVNRIGLCQQKPTDQNDFYTERKAKKQAFQRHLWKRIRCMFRRDMAFWILHILRTLSKNRHGNFAVSSFVGFSIDENIHENESTRTLLAKASKLNMYIHNIHFHIFSSSLFRQ